VKTGGSQGKGRIEIVRYKANVSVVLRGPALANGHLRMISIPEKKNHFGKADRREVDSLA
jgi:hypothetical protein